MPSEGRRAVLMGRARFADNAAAAKATIKWRIHALNLQDVDPLRTLPKVNATAPE